MKTNVCRDCGKDIHAQARGCPNCARNLDAERMLAKRLLLGLLVALILAACVSLLYLRA